MVLLLTSNVTAMGQAPFEILGIWQLAEENTTVQVTPSKVIIRNNLSNGGYSEYHHSYQLENDDTVVIIHNRVKLGKIKFINVTYQNNDTLTAQLQFLSLNNVVLRRYTGVKKIKWKIT